MVDTNAPSKLYPAFALSGDYLVKGEFQLNGVPYSCSVKVQVRAPGLRAEGCWNPMPNDMDLHVARLQNPNSCTGIGHGWFDTCENGGAGDDCYFSNCQGYADDPSPWGYTRSDPTACHGWGSRRGAGAECDNPRLDMDNISCDPYQTNPNFSSGTTDGFCGAENINLDNPKNGDKFVVGMHAFNISQDVYSHINVYCNGERRLSMGYDAANGLLFPKAISSGSYSEFGDLWEAAVVEAVVDANGKMTDCVVTPIHSHTPEPTKDGSLDYCVDPGPQGGNTTGADQWLFEINGGYPSTAAGYCWH